METWRLFLMLRVSEYLGNHRGWMAFECWGAARLAIELKEDWMRLVCELMGETEEEIPVLTMFLEESKLDMQGWRWALESFLHPEKVLLYSTGKLTGTPSLQKGKIEPGVYESGFLVIALEVVYVMMISQKIRGQAFLVLWSGKTDDDRLSYNNSRSFPLHDLANTNRSGLVTATSIPIAVDASIKSVSSVLGIVTESPENVESGEQRGNGLVIEIWFIVLVSSYTDD
ncbi:hypothetical protein BPAE_0026g00470 [Botrytis paeoniae]|uniref:Uncharacterized protein n=1 Tax=Botrytis paeoniae TaxID=278948 RepID=A0A4Z1G3A4_9HELO|nr:hypothetical protein BPAE_0026g00470 [Botrytis paeoniae]